jgi:F1F0 ATPase subunit 2
VKVTILNDAQLTEFTASLVLPLVAGIGLGLYYFGGLWWTVQRLTTARHPVLLSLGSTVVRTIGMLAGFYWVMDGQWERLLACAGGFFAARTLLVGRASQVPASTRTH